MLIKFFINSDSKAYLRGMADEFGESTNSIRHELNKLSRAGFLVSCEEGRTIMYRANIQHPFYNEIRAIVHKYLGIDKIIGNVLSQLGYVQMAFITGDYATGKDSGTIDLTIVGAVNVSYLDKLTEKVMKLISRNIKPCVISAEEFESRRADFQTSLLIWGSFENSPIDNRTIDSLDMKN
ncbi:MAG: winged helix-turn-helix domain-containing protein [Chryseolinea sp.]